MGIGPPLVVWVLPLALLAFWAWCLYDFSQTDERDIGLFSREVWLLWLTFGSLLGSLLWCFAGRPQRRR